MAGRLDISREHMEGRFGAAMVRQVFCDNGTGLIGPRFIEAVSSGRRIADAILMVAWTTDQIATLIYEDEGLRAFVLDLIMAEGMAGRPEWDTEGGQADRLRKRGTESLSLIAQGQRRSIAEGVAGQNPHAAMGKVRTNRVPEGNFIFAPSRNSRQPRGGY